MWIAKHKLLGCLFFFLKSRPKKSIKGQESWKGLKYQALNPPKLELSHYTGCHYFCPNWVARFIFLNLWISFFQISKIKRVSFTMPCWWRCNKIYPWLSFYAKTVMRQRFRTSFSSAYSSVASAQPDQLLKPVSHQHHYNYLVDR